MGDSQGASVPVEEVRAAAQWIEDSAAEFDEEIQTFFKRVRAVVGGDWSGKAADSHDQPWVDWYTSANDVVAALKGDAAALRQVVGGFVETDSTSSAAMRHQTSSLDLPEIS
ncbi:WXG100 family type VII secretion target [Nocardia miyunensis]|uniref:WXG100 family type VII secretion target n=1 Tax=Nocardia miyunensis TaxID=282684 RepID=UPI00082BACD6|nr:WXG100 family type VII secretion target [Nocardia miyunensis]